MRSPLYFEAMVRMARTPRWSVMVALGLLASLVSPTVYSNTQILVGIPSGLPGYEALDGNKLRINDPYKRGVTDCIANRLGATFIWMAYPTRRIMQMLQVNEVDMAYPMGFTAERAAAMLQSNLTWQNPDVLVSSQAIDWGDKNLRLAARLGSPQHTDYVADGYLNMTPAYAYEDLGKLLARGTVDAVIVPRSVFDEQKANWPPKIVVAAGKPRSSGFYLNKNDPKGLLKPLNDSIARCKDFVPSK